MNANAKHAIDSLISARVYIIEQLGLRNHQPEVFDSIWEGWLTIVSAVYGGQEYPDAKYFIEADIPKESP